MSEGGENSADKTVEQTAQQHEASAAPVESSSSSAPVDSVTAAHSSIKRLLESFTWSSEAVEPSAKRSRRSPGPIPIRLSTRDPWDRDSYLSRVSSFTPLRWFAAPARLSPIEIARFGWQAIEVNQLKCVDCTAELGVDEPILMQSEAEWEIFHSRLSSSHEVACPWRSLASPTIFADLSRENSTLHYEAKQRMAQIKQMEGEISGFPVLAESFLSEWRSAATEGENPLSGPESEEIPLMLAICGWTSNGADSLKCSFCTQIVELKDFRCSAASSSAPGATESLNPILEHRYFCAFAPDLTPEHGSTRSVLSDGEPGWRRVFAAFRLREARLRKISPEDLKEEAISNTRKLILINE